MPACLKILANNLLSSSQTCKIDMQARNVATFDFQLKVNVLEHIGCTGKKQVLLTSFTH